MTAEKTTKPEVKNGIDKTDNKSTKNKQPTTNNIHPNN